MNIAGTSYTSLIDMYRTIIRTVHIKSHLKKKNLNPTFSQPLRSLFHHQWPEPLGQSNMIVVNQTLSSTTTNVG